jgi:aldose 1-epimerase
METAASPSGEQWTIRYGEHEAVVVEVGGGLRSYTHAGRDVVHGYAVDEQCSGGRGQLLMPWPNRVCDGRYAFDGGKTLQLALSEPPRHHAIHGLVRWSLWSVLDRSDESMTVACRLRPQQGWSWSLDLVVAYVLSDDGLTITPQARNVGMTTAPFGFGAHPYLTAGEVHADELTLTVPAATSIDVDERLIPCGTSPVEGTELDYRGGRPIGGAVLDNGFTDLAAESDGRWRISIERPAGGGDDTGARTTLWADAAAFPWAQVFTGDTLAEPQRRTSGVAVEPMTCPADALNSGTGLLSLKPGAECSASWGITP